jgi:two-component system, cell cycle sensor histidine kinase and response regulator CckA
MPVNSAQLTFYVVLALVGGLLHLLLRRQGLGLLLQPAAGPSADDLRSCLKPPGATMSTAPRPASATPFPPRARGELILLVEDEASVRNMLSTVLLNHGFEVVTARDGVEGLSHFRKHQGKVVLVITDINMPKSNGRNFAELLRPIKPGVPVLFMSGLESNGSGRDPGKRSKDPFLLKPFKPASLLNAVHGLLHPDTPRI